MNKKVLIAIVAVVVILIGAIAGVILWGNSKEKEVNNPKAEEGVTEKKPDEAPYVGPEIPNIINKAGYISEADNRKITIKIGEEDVVIYIDKNTKVYGPDGREKDRADLKVGNYITADINGDEVEEGDTSFYAQTIYISGK